MSEYVDFHYMPLEGKITGEQVLKQTEDAINDLGNKVYSLDIDQSEIDEAIEKSNEAINTANSALAAVTTGRSVWFNNVAEMVATDIDAGVTAETKGYYVANDGGNALYLIRQEKSGDVVDGGSLIALDNGNMAELVTDGTVNVKQFGAIGNGTDDDTTVFQNTSSYAQANGFVPFVGVATYKITGNVTGAFNSFGEVTITGGGTVDIINLQEVVSDVSDIRDEVVDETASAKAYSESAATSATNASNSASSASTVATQLMAYLETKETLTAPAVDPTLTINGAAADAKVTGEMLKPLAANFKPGYYLDASGNEVADPKFGVTDFIPITESTEYTWNAGLPQGVVATGKAVVYYANKTTVRTNYSMQAGGIYTFTTPSANSKYIRLTVAISDTPSAEFRQGGGSGTLLWKQINSVRQVSNFNSKILETRFVPVENAVNSSVIENFKLGYYLDSSGNEIEDPNYGVTDFIPVTESTQYAWISNIPYSASNPGKGVVYGADKTTVRTYWSDNGYTTPITPSSNAKYVRLTVGINDKFAEFRKDSKDGELIWKQRYNIRYSSNKNREHIDAMEESFGDYIDGNYKKGYYLDSSGNEVANENYGVSEYIPVKPSTEYTWYSAVPSDVPKLGKLVIFTYDGTQVRNYYSDYGLPYTFTTPSSNVGYIRMTVGLGNVEGYLKEGNTVIWQRADKLKATLNNYNDRLISLEDIKDSDYTILDSTIADGVDAYKTKLTKSITQNCFTFGFITDVHLRSIYMTQHLKRLYVATKVAQMGIWRFLTFGGDLVSGEDTIDADIQTMYKGHESLMYNSTTPVYMIRGNHDGGHKTWKAKIDNNEHPTSADIVTNVEWYNMMDKNLDVVKDPQNPTGAYFYKDFDDFKIRVICLNCYDFDGTDANGNVYNAMYGKSSVLQAQMTWFAASALNFMDKTDRTGWGVIVFSHDGVDADNSAFGSASLVEGLLQAFKSGTSYTGSYDYTQDTTGHYAVTITKDFASQGPLDYIAFIHGHTHTDRIKYNNGTPHISTGAAHPDVDETLPEGATIPIPRTEGTLSEYLYDTLCVDRTNRTIQIYRFGAGSDRTATF